MKSVLKEDLSTLTTISESVINKLNDKVIWCISNTVEKTIKEKEDIAEINLGYGTLLINFSNNEIRYKFIPSSSLEKSITNTVLTESNDLISAIEESLVDKITNTYKSFF